MGATYESRCEAPPETPHDATAVGFCLTRKSSVSPIADVHNQTRFFKMARLILNCEGVGLIMRELGRDIVMIGRAHRIR